MKTPPNVETNIEPITNCFIPSVLGSVEAFVVAAITLGARNEIAMMNSRVAGNLLFTTTRS
jgi:hypothetical protein